MVLVVGLDAMNEGQVVNMLCQVWKAVGDVLSGLAVTLKLKGAPYGGMRKRQAPLELSGNFRDSREGLAVQLVENRLVFEGVHLADSTTEEHEDAVLRLALHMRQPDLERVHPYVRLQVSSQRSTESESAETIKRFRQKVPA